MKYDFTGKSIKCDIWEQMLHLAKLAEEQGYSKLVPFSELWFNRGSVYFTIDSEEYMMLDCVCDPIETTYSDFINTLPTEVVEVTGCGDCPFYRNVGSGDYCGYPKKEIEVDDIFSICPLKESSITIKLKQNDATGN